jgi:hypothetical protein
LAFKNFTTSLKFELAASSVKSLGGLSSQGDSTGRLLRSDEFPITFRSLGQISTNDSASSSVQF